MLRISRHDETPRVVCLKLEGKLDEAQVPVLRAECREILDAGLELELELTCLRFADGAGVDLLHRLRSGGVRLVGATPLVAGLLQKEK